MRRVGYREPGGKNRIPILDDVSRGTGGIAGGKFTFNSDDTLDDTSYDALIDSDGTFIVQDAGGSKILLHDTVS